MEKSQIDTLAKFEGMAEITLYDEFGNVKEKQIGKNIITAAGLLHIANRTSGLSTPAAMGWMELGTSSNTASVGDVTLLAAIASPNRTSTTVSSQTSVQNGDVIRHICTFGSGTGTGAVAEAGIFNVVTANTPTMLNRICFAVINKGASDTLTITWNVRIA